MTYKYFALQKIRCKKLNYRSSPSFICLFVSHSAFEKRTHHHHFHLKVLNRLGRVSEEKDWSVTRERLRQTMHHKCKKKTFNSHSSSDIDSENCKWNMEKNWNLRTQDNPQEKLYIKGNCQIKVHHRS